MTSLHESQVGDNAIVSDFVKSNVLTRRPCHVCGGCTEKVEVLCEVTKGPEKGLRICENCLRVGSIDERLARWAADLEARAADTRRLIGRLKVPSYAEWEAKMERVNVAWFAAEAFGVDYERGANASRQVLANDAAYQHWLPLYQEYCAKQARDREEAPRERAAGATPAWLK